MIPKNNITYQKCRYANQLLEEGMPWDQAFEWGKTIVDAMVEIKQKEIDSRNHDDGTI